MQSYWKRDHLIDLRPVDGSRYLSREPHAHGPAYLDAGERDAARQPEAAPMRAGLRPDFTLLDTALIAHGKLLFDSGHPAERAWTTPCGCTGSFRADEWLLYVQDSPNAARRAGLSAVAVSTYVMALLMLLLRLRRV